MIREFLHARRYLAPSLDSFWGWSDGGDVLTWRKGPTIVFRAEVVEVLRPLVPHGFPHFDAIVLFLAACRSVEKIGEPEIEIHKVLPSLTESEKRNWRYRDLLVALAAIAAISTQGCSSFQNRSPLPLRHPSHCGHCSNGLKATKSWGGLRDWRAACSRR